MTHSKRELGFLSRAKSGGTEPELDAVFERVRDARSQRHAAARASAGLEGAHVGVHGADELDRRLLRDQSGGAKRVEQERAPGHASILTVT